MTYIMENLPLVSAIVPVYNGENYLREAIESILSQTYPNIEIIVVDDGSIDSTREIMASYGDKIRSIHKENGGATSALNCGIRAMNGEWFAWLSHDDLWEQTFIEKQIANLQAHPECMFSYSGFYNIDSDGIILNKIPALWYDKGKDLRHMIVYGEYTYGITVVINRKCFDEVGVFDKKWKYVQDTDMWFRLFQKYDACYVSELLAKRRVHPCQTGVISKNDFKSELLEFYSYYSKKLSSIQYYPILNSTNVSFVKKKFISIWSHLYYKKYVTFCYTHCLPITPKQYVFRLLIPTPLKRQFINIHKMFQKKYNDYNYGIRDRVLK